MQHCNVESLLRSLTVAALKTVVEGRLPDDRLPCRGVPILTRLPVTVLPVYPYREVNIENNSELTIARLAPLLKGRKLSPVELTDWLLGRIERLQPRLNAFITVTAEKARAQARRAEAEIARGDYRGALHGIPISLKDLLYTRGIRTTGGSKILRSFVPDADSEVFERLSKAGAVLVGKTNLHEFAFGVTNVNPHYGPVRNPWGRNLISGGSSGGSAVSVSAAMALASIGTDTGGSIRIPAAACGCIGFKPTYGLISRTGIIPLSNSLDHVGPLSRCVEDAAILFFALVDPEARSWLSTGDWDSKQLRKMRVRMKGLRVGVPRQYFFERLQPEVRSSVLAAVRDLEDCGAEIQDVSLGGLQDTAEVAFNITVAEALVYHWNWLKARPGDYGVDVRKRLQSGRRLSAAAYLMDQERRREYSRALDAAFLKVDVLATPTLPVTAPGIGDATVKIGRLVEDTRLALLSLTRPANLAGLPAISVPCGFSGEGLPIGIQFIGRRFDDIRLLRLAYLYEQFTGRNQRFPPDPDSSDTDSNPEMNAATAWKT